MKNVALVLMLLVMGCSSGGGGIQEYREAASKGRSQSLSNSVVQGASSAALEQNYNGEITIADPMFLNLGYASNYDVYRIKIPAPGTYHVNVKALCDCLGFKKTLIFPSIKLLDVNMKELKIGDGKVQEGKQAGSLLKATLPAHLDADWKIDVGAPGEYYLVVAPYNKNLEKLALAISNNFNTSAGGYNVYGTVTNIPLVAHPYGKYIVRVEKNSLL